MTDQTLQKPGNMRPSNVIFPFAALLFSAVMLAQNVEAMSIQCSAQEGLAGADCVLITDLEAQEPMNTSLPYSYMSLQRTLLASASSALRASYIQSYSQGSKSQAESDKWDLAGENGENYRNIKNWEVLDLDPREYPCFANDRLVPEYISYDPPKGFTGEQIMQFKGAKEAFRSVEEVEELLALRARFESMQGQVKDSSEDS
ncbi:hypothetical protein FB446DRAFT_784859 [Lentinula raphanica]|nr:hypothetical protein FB446DRAFT_784859 [Lentinula raphanica]